MRFYKEATGIDFYFVTNCDIKGDITRTGNFYITPL